MRQAQPLRTIIVEDNAHDADLLVHQLRRTGFDPVWERVETEDGFVAALNTRPDIVLCDYSLPEFDALLAVDILAERGDPVPLIIVSGTIGEAVAVEAMRRGAADYLLKDRLARIGPAVEQALDRRHAQEERMKADRALREAEARYRMLVEQMPAIVYTWAAAGGLDTFVELYVSPQIETVLGYPPREWLANPTFWVDRLHPEDRDDVLAEISRCIESGESFKMEYRELARNGRVVWLHDEAAVVSRDDTGRAILYQGVQMDITDRRDAEDERRRSLEQIRHLDQQRRELLGKVMTTQEEERRVIAADIHDDSLQGLAVVAIRLASLARDHPDIQKDEKFLAIQRDLSGSIARLRHLMFELHPHNLEIAGLESTLRAQLDEIETLPGAPQYCMRYDLQREPSVKTRAILHRVAQEAITNARKHSNAMQVTIALEERNGGFFVKIEDDGVGFEVTPSDASPPNHLGLTSMRERAELAGGWLRLESQPGAGTNVEFWLPDEGGG